MLVCEAWLSSDCRALVLNLKDVNTPKSNEAVMLCKIGNISVDNLWGEKLDVRGT